MSVVRMESNRKDVSMDHEKCLELAQLCHAIKNKRSSFVQKFIEKNRTNTRIPNNSFFRDFMPELIGYTLLHVAYHEKDINTYRLLLSVGADFTLKNAEGSTVVHQIVENSYDDDILKGRLKNPFLAATLFSHYEYGIHQNPTSKHGITHLHAACMANSADAVVELLTHGADVNQAVNINSPYFPGYTPLHFAVRFSELCTLETIKILIKHGADFNIEDKYNMTPLDILLERHAKIVKLMETETDFYNRDLLKALVANEKIIGFLIEIHKAEDLSRFKVL